MSDRLKVRHLAVENAGLTRVDEFDEATVIRRAEEMRAEVWARIMGRVGAAIRKVFSNVVRSIEQAQAMRVLYQMDDDTLKDIGITRDQIPSYVLGLTSGRTTGDVPVDQEEVARKAA